ncbi:MAG: DNA cytosine methyltransferase, partial [Actinomycetes bacterium]
TYGAVYGRMRWDQPAPTLTTGFMTPGRGRFTHPLERRTLLPREAARIQGFPDNYRFEHAQAKLGRSAIAKGIGDAVPSILGFAATLSALANRPD